jgi:hypothetical protein
MKKVSVSLFFAVMWKGVCQALGWFLGLFGYKKDGKFAKCVWGLFATSGAIIMAFFALAIVCAGVEVAYEHWFKGHDCDDEYCYHSEYVNRDIYFHNTEDGKGYIYNKRTGEKLIKHIAWIAKPLGKDTLVCYSDGKKRGYFSKNTGKVIIKPKYDHAWVFSDGLASVDDNGYIKFIDGTDKVVIDQKMPYIPNMEGYVFHAGYCVVDSGDEEKLYGLIDKTGKIVLPKEYSFISPTNDLELWRVQKGNENGVLNRDLESVIPLMECSIYIDEGTIDVTMPNHTVRKFDYQGQLINDFYVTNVCALEYEKDEILYQTRTHDDEGNEYATPFVESYRPKAIARLYVYSAGGHMGLMTSGGHVVTMPLYKDIDAIGYDLYLCTSTNYDKVIVNGRGEIVK